MLRWAKHEDTGSWDVADTADVWYEFLTWTDCAKKLLSPSDWAACVRGQLQEAESSPNADCLSSIQGEAWLYHSPATGPYDPT